MARETAMRCKEKAEERGYAPVEAFDAAGRSRFRVQEDRVHLPGYVVARP